MPGNLRVGLTFIGVGALLGLSLGYGVAYIGRLVNIFFLDALFMGVLGGAMLLLLGLSLRLRPENILVVGCMVLACSSWLGQRAGEYRFALRSHSRAAVVAADESSDSSEIDRDMRAQLIRESTRLFHDDLIQEVGHSGVQGFMEQQWRRGVLLLRFGGWSHRIPLPVPAVVIGQILVTLGTFLLAWMLVRRLQWLPACPRCGRPLQRPVGGPPEQEEALEDFCPTCAPGGAPV